MATRSVTGPLLSATGQPLAGFIIHFIVMPPTHTADATFPRDTVEVITDADGQFDIDLVTDILYQVRYVSNETGGQRVYAPSGSRYDVVVPTGSGSIPLHDLQTLNNDPISPPQAITIFEDMASNMVPGAVYPVLLLSPEGSANAAGPITPTVGSAVTLVPGTYGTAWHVADGAAESKVTLPYPADIGTSFTVLARGQYHAGSGGPAFLIVANDSSGWGLGRFTSSLAWYTGGSRSTGGPPVFSGSLVSLAATLTPKLRRSFVASSLSTSKHGPQTAVAPVLPLNFLRVTTLAGEPMQVESVLIFPYVLPDSEIFRLLELPTAWTMKNTGAQLTVASTFEPNRKITAGPASLCAAPGAVMPLITTLANSTLVRFDGTLTVTVSTVDYVMITTSTHGAGWIPLANMVVL